MQRPEKDAHVQAADDESDDPVHDQQVHDAACHRQPQRNRQKEDHAGQGDVVDDDVLAEEVDGEHFRYFRSRRARGASDRSDYEYIISKHKLFVNSAYVCSVIDRHHIWCRVDYLHIFCYYGVCNLLRNNNLFSVNWQVHQDTASH